MATLCELLTRSPMRLLTLVGPGGIGKTRLAMQVASELRTHFAHGVCFVSLAPISDPALVLPTIAQELDCRGPSAISVGERVKNYLQAKDFLLILDNFEHVISSAPLVEELLLTCPSVTMLVTSRAVLHVQGEQEFLVPPLALPHLNQVAESEDLPQYAAINLFLHRVRAVKPAFEITATNARTVAKICIRLDGLPLAIELAAARVKVLPSQELFARLSQRFLVLTGGPRTAPVRQQTLRNALKWSYDLLTGEEQVFFRLLAIFAGGCSLEAAEAVYHRVHKGRGMESEERDGLTMITSLIDQSLVQQTAGEGEEPRLVLLETIREYGWECLQECGELEHVQRAHAEYYLAFAEQGERHLCPRDLSFGGQQLLWLTRFNRDQENLRLAILWFLQHEEAEGALRLCLAVAWYCLWAVGNWEELIGWYETALALPNASKHRADYAEVLAWLCNLSYMMWRYKGQSPSSSVALGEKSVVLLQELGEKRRLITALSFLGRAYQYLSHDEGRARAAFEEAAALGRELGPLWTGALPVSMLSTLLKEQGDLGQARQLLEECLVLSQHLRGGWGIVNIYSLLALVARAQGDTLQAQAFAREALCLARATGNKLYIVPIYFCLGDLAWLQNERTATSAWYTQGLASAREMGYSSYVLMAVWKLGEIALLEGDTVQAVKLVQEGLEVARKTEERQSLCRFQILLGEIAHQQGNDALAQAHFQDSLMLARTLTDSNALGRCLLGLSRLASRTSQFWQAARMRTAAESRLNLEQEMSLHERAMYAQENDALRAHLGEIAFAKAKAEGQTMTLEDLLAAEGTPAPAPAASLPDMLSKAPVGVPVDLTTREVEVLRLLAQGLTDTQIAGYLGISPRTVNFHLTSIYRKIQVSSRSAATRYAMEHQLA